MQIKVTLIRSGITKSGAGCRYIGATDEPLCDEGIRLLKSKKQEGCYPEPARVYASGQKRCIETAKLLYDGQFIFLAEGFSPYDYGEFEGKTYAEIGQDPRFLNWALGEAGRLPGADDPYPARYGAVAAFERIMTECAEGEVGSAVIVTHRSVILAIMRERCTPRLAYGHITLEHGGGVSLTYDACTKSLCVETLF